MPLKVACPACGNQFVVADNQAGAQGQCPRCSQRLQFAAPRAAVSAPPLA